MKRQTPLSWLMTALTLLLCAALCASALTLYFGGLARRAESGSATAPVFTREAAALQLRWVWPLLAVWACAAVFAAFAGRLAPPNGLLPPGRGQAVRVLPAREGRGAGRARLALYLLAAALIVLGVLNGGSRDVLVKAINICTECIGFG